MTGTMIAATLESTRAKSEKRPAVKLESRMAMPGTLIAVQSENTTARRGKTRAEKWENRTRRKWETMQTAEMTLANTLP